MAYRWGVVYDRLDRLCYQVTGKNATVTTLGEGRFLVSVEKAREIFNCSRDEALMIAINLLDKASN